MIKLVACDLDGTLFNSDMAVSKENINAIHQAQNHGIEFLVATGRAPKESKSILKDADIHTGFINLNGALVYNTAGDLIIKHPIAKNEALQLIDLLHQEQYYFEILTAEHVYSEDVNARISNVAHFMANLNPDISLQKALEISSHSKAITDMKQIDDYREYFSNNDEEIMKFIVFDMHDQNPFANTIPKINKLGNFSITSSDSSNIEINAANAQKGIALLDYARTRDIKREQIAAIGDNLNDQSMIKQAGIGVAMGNAIPEIKKIAQIVTSSNNENGVAAVLNRFIIENQ